MAKDLEYSPGVERYLKVIGDYDKKFGDWRAKVEKIIKRYRDEGKQISTQLTSTARMNILWANVQTLKPAMFSCLPKPDVFRRWRDNDPVGRVAALLLERGLEYELDQYDDFSSAMDHCVFDRLIGSRGTAWVRYEPTIVEDEVQPSDEEAQPGDYEATGSEDRPTGDGQETAGDVEPSERVAHECAPVDYIHWRDFGHSVARTWSEVDCVWRVLYLTRDAIEGRFGKKVADRIPIDSDPNRSDTKASNTITGKHASRAKIYELWDKSTRKAYWISKSCAEVLDEKDDPLQLDDFWPCPRPLYGTMTTDELVPVPEFVLYQDLANELDIITDRIDGLIRALKVTGCYNNSFPEIGRLFTEASNTDLVAVKDWAAFAASNGLEGALSLVDLQPIFQALEAAYAARKECIDQIYQVTGIGDLMRFDNDPQSTATAEKLKGQYGTLRLRQNQKEVVRFATDIIKLKAQIICAKFQPEMIATIGGAMQLMQEDQQYVPMAIELLRNNVLREFRVEISSDALVQMDEAQEKSDRMEFLTAVGKFMEQGTQAVEQQPAMAPVIAEMFKFGVQAFKVGKGLEGMLDQAIEQLKKTPPQPKPDPQMAKVQGELQLKQAEMQINAQAEQSKQQAMTQGEQDRARIEAWLEQQKQQAQAQQESQTQALEGQRAAMQAHLDARLEAQKQASDERIAVMQQEMQRFIAEQNNAVKLEIARIQAQTSMPPQQSGADTMEMMKQLMGTLKKSPKVKRGTIKTPSGASYSIDMTEQDSE